MYFLELCMLPCPKYYAYIALCVCNQFDVILIARNHNSVCNSTRKVSFLVPFCSKNSNRYESVTQNSRKCVTWLNIRSIDDKNGVIIPLASNKGRIHLATSEGWDNTLLKTIGRHTPEGVELGSFKISRISHKHRTQPERKTPRLPSFLGSFASFLFSFYVQVLLS